MPPTRMPEYVAEFIAPARRLPHVLPHIRPFVERDAHRIVGVNVLRQPEARSIGFALRLERPEPPGPDDQGAGMIAIDVARIGAVVHAMMRRRVHYPFERPQRAYQLRMNPELVEQADRLHGQNHHWAEA